MKRHLIWVAIAIFGLTLTCRLIAAQGTSRERRFVAYLSGHQEVPPRDTGATGQAIFHLSADGTELEYRLIVANIENIVGAHIHLGHAEMNGPIQVSLFGPAAPGGGETNGVLTANTIAVSSALVDAMSAGNTYVNVRTNDGVAPANTGPGDFPGGEIRGQIRPLEQQ